MWIEELGLRENMLSFHNGIYEDRIYNQFQNWLLKNPFTYKEGTKKKVITVELTTPNFKRLKGIRLLSKSLQAKYPEVKDHTNFLFLKSDVLSAISIQILPNCVIDHELKSQTDIDQVLVYLERTYLDLVLKLIKKSDLHQIVKNISYPDFKNFKKYMIFPKNV